MTSIIGCGRIDAAAMNEDLQFGLITLPYFFEGVVSHGFILAF